MAEGDKGGGVIKLPGVVLPMPRTFRAIDRLFARPLEALEEHLDQKRAENISAHIDAVEKATVSEGYPTHPEPSLRQFDLLARWVRPASSIGDDDPTLAAAWRAALERIRSNDPFAQCLVEALENLTVVDIASITQAKRNSRGHPTPWTLSSLPSSVIDALRKNGLIYDRFNPTSAIFRISLSLAIVLLLISLDFYFGRLIDPYIHTSATGNATVMTTISIGPRESSDILRFSTASHYILWIGLFIVVAVVALEGFWLKTRFDITDLGKRFISTFDKYSCTKPANKANVVSPPAAAESSEAMRSNSSSGDISSPLTAKPKRRSPRNGPAASDRQNSPPG